MRLRELTMKCDNIDYWTYLMLIKDGKTLYSGYFEDMPYSYVYYEVKSFKLLCIGVEVVLE